MVKVKMKIGLKHNIKEVRDKVQEFKKDANFGDVVFAGIRAIAVAQRRAAPSRTSKDIARSIKVTNVNKTRNGWSATSYTNLRKAIYTNEGTATHIGGNEYEIKWTDKRTNREVRVMHPGIRGQHWFERGANEGSPLAYKAFKEKVDRLVRR